MSNKELDKVNFIKDIDESLEKWQSIADADSIKTREECMDGFVVEIFLMMQNAQKKGLEHLMMLSISAFNRTLLSWRKFDEADNIVIELNKCYLLCLAKINTKESQEEIERIVYLLNKHPNLKVEVA